MPAGETIDVRVDDDVAAEVPINANGVGSATVTAPRGRPPRPIKLRAQDSLQDPRRVGVPRQRARRRDVADERQADDARAPTR